MSLATVKSGQLIESSLVSERNPVVAHIKYEGDAVAPHATTEQARYTVPARKFAIIKNAIAHARVETAATTAALKGTYITLNAGGVEYYFCFVNLGADRNAIGNHSIQMSSNEVLLKAGDYVKIATNNLSTGGTVSHTGTVLITQYDL